MNIKKQEFKIIQEDAMKRYSERYNRLGVVPQALGWGKKEDQIERFSSLIKNINFNNKRVLDIGCGFADFYLFLLEHNIKCQYIGIDIIPDFVKYCKKQFPECEFYQKNVLLDSDSIDKVDIVISLGTLNFKLENMDNLEYTKAFMERSYSLANEMLVLDFLSTKLTSSYPKEDFVYYHSPNKIIDLAFELSDNIQLIHNYKPIPQKRVYDLYREVGNTMIDAHFHYNLTSNNLLSDISSIDNIMQENDIQKVLLHIIDYCISVENMCNIKWPEKILPSIMLNPFEEESNIKLEMLSKHNIKFVKLLPYEQNIFYEDYPLILEYARKVEEQKMCLVICAAYGSKNIYRTNGIHLVEYLLRSGINTPIIVAHGGMPKIFDMMLLMDEYPNLFMDISFALYYWWGSTIIQDYAFVIKKLSGKRIFYGSDYPYVSIEDSKNIFNEFCLKFEISDDIKEDILANNFNKFYTNQFDNLNK